MDDRGYGDQVKRGVASAVDTASDLAGKAQTAAAEAGSTIQGAVSETVRCRVWGDHFTRARVRSVT